MGQPQPSAQPTPLRIDFPPDLPVSGQRAAIEAALRAHQVVIVCGETGSGKTTQLPKMALALALAAEKGAGRGKRPRLIGHTQPRRIAASSVARRIAEELHTPLGEVVGYKVRFADRLSPTARIKLMTDGILLAETQSDALLAAYGTLIIDEAHERSLNIDFLLGHLKRILPRRPDLKVIVTSATIDAQRFAEHFTDAKGRPAPVLQVSGRTYPVEVRWRPFEESRDFGLNEAIAEALDELWPAAPAGDVLVFLPGEREIRDAADHLRAHLARRAATRGAEVLPLYARLSAAEQERVFAPHSAARVVLATNVAETSLTVPGIRFVIDSGTARVKRYSLRSKVEQLLIEPVSQAAAGQRAGRCGRLGPGVCIRLYEEKEFAQRPRFTDPEILRSSLAAVILRLKSLRLGAGRVQDFPFLDAPSGRAIADGFQLLAELGAVDEAQNLTALGRELARLPLDPRVGRMLLEARARGALPEVLVIAAALSVQDVRERPVQAQAQADQAHARFADERSEFSGLLRLWQWLDEVRGGRAPASQAQAAKQAREAKAAPRQPSRAAMAALPAARRAELALEQARRALQGQGAETPAEEKPTHRLSNRQWEAALRAAFISVRRVREWRDIHAQLAAAMQGGGKEGRGGGFSASYEAIHKSLLAGLLGNVGCRMEAGSGRGEYLGARGIKFFRHPGAHLKRRNGGSAQWIICAELVETTRLFGRSIAAIEPQWLEEIGAHLIKKQVLDPHWEKKAQDVVALERGTLYGLTVYSGRRKSYGKYDARGARELLIRQALVAGLSEDALPDEWLRSMPFLRANARTIASVQEMEHKSRRQDLLVDEELIYAFYDAHIPEHIATGRDFEAWWRQAQRGQPKLLHLSREELMRHEAAGITTAAYPNVLRLGGVDCAASYLHQPGDARDGLTVSVPLFALNQIDAARCEWLAPGMLREKLQALLKSLPQKPRSRFQPLAESAARLAQDYAAPERFGKGSLVDALLETVRAETGLRVTRAEMRLENLPPHLFMNFRILGEHGRQIGEGRDLAALKAEHGGAARGAFQALAALKTARATLEKPEETQEEKPAQKPAEKPAKTAEAAEAADGDALHTRWDFGALPELMEIRRKGQTLIGFPALVDAGEAVRIEVFDEPDVAAARHRAGLRRLVALQIKEQLKYLEKNIPDLQRMAVAYMPLGTEAQLRESILALALERAFLAEPLPADEEQFMQRVQDGKARLGLIAGEIARLAAAILAEYTTAARRVKDARAAAPDAARDAEEQMQRLLPASFLLAAPWETLQHFPRYLKAIAMRFEKRRADPERDARHMAEVRAQEQRFWRTVSARQGQQDERLQALRWMLEELRVSLFAQELRTRQPVSVKRLEKAWAQIQG
ncbi:MAG: ATP-dependent RNA helicase HrpA [Ottowia sp.]|nr:ATP-dependent RNA helicase HrpA [Ottowia sp.]